ncbi:hypothetical protein CPB84DRAFT_1815719 [Gymnopilus junonius]|uniref:SH3 domain-containing protein n=1 Tax=Gymnopilus junonius TaxID=109634 RepID=A0A9P5TMN3_GYMJU|nr:hypothetical protein CPB84DRAFT_1815719 [Gymnopilus junonius]
MGFSNLQPHEKDAFFSLLDEYFSSRPEIFASLGQSDDPAPANTAQGAAVSAVGRAMAAHPDTAARFMSAGAKQFANARNIGGGGSGPEAETGASDNDREVTSVADRVAAFSSSRNNRPASSGPPSVADKPSASGLVSVKKFGNSVDTSSTKGFLSSLHNKPATPAPVVTPPAFAPRQNNFAPPPARRAGSTNSLTSEPAPPAPPPPPVPRFQPQPEPEPEEEAGEWAEALYDYNSGEAGDLRITEGEHVLVLERTSDDWWTGEVNGEKGLFPASYVKIL